MKEHIFLLLHKIPHEYTTIISSRLNLKKTKT